MAVEIKPLSAADLEDLSRFLTDGFRPASDAVFAVPEVLRWKYLSAQGWNSSIPCSYVARDDAGQIIGHVGVCRTAFHGPSILKPGAETLHMIDWLGSPAHRSIGASLMRKVHETAPTQFGLGGSEAGRTVIKRGGYEPQQPVAVYERVLQPTRWFRHQGGSLARACLHVAREIAMRALRPVRKPQLRLKPKRVSDFDDEVCSIALEAMMHTILTDRAPNRLNHLLRFPLQRVSGWHLLLPSGQLCGFALLNVLPQQEGSVQLGKIVDCLLLTTDTALWHAAFDALTSELTEQGADAVQAFASTPWVTEALQRCGFVSRFALEFSLRDRGRLIPQGVPVHLMPIEADYAYS
jgi:hypothetical protein